MAQTAAHLVDEVLPDVPYRQWVLTLPFPLRFPVAFDKALQSAVLRIFWRVIRAYHLERAREIGIDNAEFGAITVIQRFGSALQMTPHFHTLAMDGVFRREGDTLSQFVPLGWLTQRDVETVVADVAERVKRSLKARGLLVEGARGEEGAAVDLGGHADRTLASCYAAAMGGKASPGASSTQEQDLFAGRGDQRGSAQVRRQEPDLCARDNGFSLHAAVRIGAHMRDRLERLVRYMARPPISDDRLKPTNDGRISVRLKTPYSDGTTHIFLTPRAFLQRLCALIPRPRAHRLRYHGVLAPASEFRPQVVPTSEAVTDPQATLPTDQRTSAGKGGQPTVPQRQLETAPKAKRKVRWLLWAYLIRRVFATDPLVCPKCEGRMRIVAAILRADAIAKILACLDITLEPPRMRPARAPPEESNLDVADLVEVDV